MRHSIRVKFAMIFIGLMAAVLVSIWVMSGFFLEGFYAKQKLRFLGSAYENLNTIVMDRRFQGQNITEELQSLFPGDGKQTGASCLLRPMNDKYNTTTVIQDSITGELIPLVKDGKFLANALHRYILGIIDPKIGTLISQDDHQVQKIYDRRSQGYHLQSWGFFDDDRITFTMSIPLANIRDSVDISSEFLTYMGFTALVLGSALMYYVTKEVASLIRSLAALSARTSGLDFEARYTGDSEDEIGVLGHNISTLSEELKETIGELKTANSELQKDIKEKVKIDKTRREFIANVPHELKTPTTLIQGYAEDLTEGMVEDEDSRSYYCEVIMGGAGRMNKMVKQLLTLTALEFGSDIPVMERFDIATLIYGILLSVGILLQQKEARVVPDQEESVWVRADEFKIEEVIINYLNNIMNHLKGERRIEIYLERKEKEIHIAMLNAGRRILEEDLGSPWIKFYKIDKARTREYGGSDIELSIVKTVMDFHSRSCGVENVNGGMESWFTADSRT